MSSRSVARKVGVKNEELDGVSIWERLLTKPMTGDIIAYVLQWSLVEVVKKGL
jgi:hypothetical protein